MGQKQKTEKRERGRLNDGNNNGQATLGACKHAWRTQAAWANLINLCHSVFTICTWSYGHLLAILIMCEDGAQVLARGFPG